jgi:hypothetical protein
MLVLSPTPLPYSILLHLSLLLVMVLYYPSPPLAQLIFLVHYVLIMFLFLLVLLTRFPCASSLSTTIVLLNLTLLVVL